MSKTERPFEIDEDVCVWMSLAEWYDVLDTLRTIEVIADSDETKALMAKLHEEIKAQVFEYIRISAEMAESGVVLDD